MWQRTLEQVLQGIPGVQCILDDNYENSVQDNGSQERATPHWCQSAAFIPGPGELLPPVPTKLSD